MTARIFDEIGEDLYYVIGSTETNGVIELNSQSCELVFRFRQVITRHCGMYVNSTCIFFSAKAQFSDNITILIYDNVHIGRHEFGSVRCYEQITFYNCSMLHDSFNVNYLIIKTVLAFAVLV